MEKAVILQSVRLIADGLVFWILEFKCGEMRCVKDTCMTKVQLDLDLLSLVVLKNSDEN